MALSSLNALMEQAYFTQLYDILKARENAALAAGTATAIEARIHAGGANPNTGAGGDGTPTIGYGWNLASRTAVEVSDGLTYAYGGAVTALQQQGIDILVAWRNGTPVVVGGATVTLTNQNIIDMSRSLYGDANQIAAIQSLTMTDVEATRLLDVAIQGAGNIDHIEGPAGVFGYEAGLDWRLEDDGGVAYSVERIGLMSAYYNAQGLIGAGLQAAIGADDRARAWYELRYNHTNFENSSAQTRRAAEAEQVGLVSQAAKNDPAGHINEYARSLSVLFNDNDNANIRIYSRIIEPTLNGLAGAAGSRDQHDPLAAAISDELLILSNHFVAPAIGAQNARLIDWVQFDEAGAGSTMSAGDAAAAGVVGGKDSSNTVNLILGEAGNDRLEGKGATDYLFGGADNDILIGDGAGLDASTAGNDVLHGGAGTDTVDYSAEDGIANPTFEASDIQVGQPTAAGEPTLLVTDTYGKTDTLISIEWLIAPGGGDAIDLTGFTGNIGIDGGGGDDTLTGGSGNDSLFGGEGFDSIASGDGDDLLGNIHAPTFDYSALDQTARDAVAGSEVNANNDPTVLDGGAGNDIYLIDFSSNQTNRQVQIVDADAGSKIFVRDIETGEVDALSGVIARVAWVRPSYTVRVLADDCIELGPATIPSETQYHYGIIANTTGAFYYLGADATDIFEITSQSGAATVTRVAADPSENFDPNVASAADRFSSVSEFLATFVLAPGDVVEGDSGYQSEGGPQYSEEDIDLVIWVLDTQIDSGAATFANIGNAQFSDLGLSDQTTGAGVPTMSGGVTTAQNNDGSVTSTGSAQNDFVYSFNGVQHIALFDGYDTASTGAADDTIDLGAGDDFADGGAGDDLIIGGAGADTLDGGAGFDTADYSTAPASVQVNLAVGAGFGSDAGGDILTNIERVIGSAWNDTITGSALDDSLFGGDKADVLEGGAGADLLDGGLAIDTVSYAGAAAGVALNLASGGTGGDAAGDIYVSIERVSGSNFDDAIVGAANAETLSGGLGSDLLDGGDGDDLLNGQSGTDSLFGAAGADTLNGGTGADTLTGAAGNDRFDFSAGFGADGIVDFTAGAGAGDVIRLIGLGAAFDSFAEISAAATEVGADTVIDFGAGNTITLLGVSLTALNADDFLFG